VSLQIDSKRFDLIKVYIKNMVCKPTFDGYCKQFTLKAFFSLVFLRVIKVPVF